MKVNVNGGTDSPNKYSESSPSAIGKWCIHPIQCKHVLQRKRMKALVQTSWQVNNEYDTFKSTGRKENKNQWATTQVQLDRLNELCKSYKFQAKEFQCFLDGPMASLWLQGGQCGELCWRKSWSQGGWLLQRSYSTHESYQVLKHQVQLS